MSDYNVSEAVNKGAALLDKVRPNWYKEINLDTFHFLNPSLCIIGQLYGQYLNGEEALELNTLCDAVDHGFDITAMLMYECLAIQDEWVKVIQERLSR